MVGDFERSRILLVDDRPENLLALRAALDRPDYDLLSVNSGEEALRALLSGSFAVILLDVAMPGLDGFKTAELIKRRERSRNIPIIFVTAIATDISAVFRGYEEGAVDYLIKPVDMHALRAKVEVFVELDRQAKEIERQQQARLAAEQRERELAEALYDKTFQEAPIGIGHATLEGRWVRANHRLSEILGREHQNLETHTLVEYVDPADRELLERAIEKIVTRETERHHGEYRFVRADGSRVWISLNLSMLTDRQGQAVQLTLIEDISEEKHLMESLRASESKFSRLRESGMLGIVVVNASRVITDANDAFLEMVGRTRPALGSFTMDDLTEPEFAAVQERAQEEIAQHGVCRPYEKALMRPDGRRAWMLVGMAALEDPSGGMVGFTLDISSRKRMEQSRARLLRELREDIQARDDFISLAAHELRNPLTPLRVQVASLLMRCEKSDEPFQPAWLRRQLVPLDRAVKRFEDLLQRLVDVSQLTVGKMRLERELVDLTEVVSEVVRQLHEEAASAKSEVQVKASGEPITGLWDRTRLEQLVSHLVSNALKYGAGRRVELEVDTRGDTARVSVRDHGVGIAPEDQARIFDRFQRMAPLSNFGGFGLGLWIARQIIEAHGGEIEVWSEPGEGSLFTFILPRQVGREPTDELPPEVVQ